MREFGYRSNWAYLAVPTVTERGARIFCRLQPQLIFDFAAKAGPRVHWHVGLFLRRSRGSF